ncbi:host cell division inhibitor Icd-like protein [Klebsiella pneumoniae]
MSTIASSEREARRQFASRFILVLSARIRVSEVIA